MLQLFQFSTHWIKIHAWLMWIGMGFLMPLAIILVRFSKRARERGDLDTVRKLVYAHEFIQVLRLLIIPPLIISWPLSLSLQQPGSSNSLKKLSVLESTHKSFRLPDSKYSNFTDSSSTPDHFLREFLDYDALEWSLATRIHACTYTLLRLGLCLISCTRPLCVAPTVLLAWYNAINREGQSPLEEDISERKSLWTINVYLCRDSI